VPPTSSVGTLVVVPSRVGVYGGFGSSFFFDPFLLGGPFGFYGGSFYSASAPIDVSGDLSTPSPFAATGPSGGLRLQMDQKDAQVFVDGYYAGVVDDFDGPFQHVNLRPGPHHVEIRAFGFDPLGFDVYIVERHTTPYRGTLTPR
jgi:hypothetical protein